MTPAERQRRRRQRLKEQGAGAAGSGSVSSLEAAWQAASPDERRAFCDRHGIEEGRADVQAIVRQLRDAADQAQADADSGNMASAFGRLSATVGYVIERYDR